MDDEIRNKKSTEEIGGDASIRDSTSKWMPSKMRFAWRMVSPNGVPRSNPRAATPKLQNGQQPFADGNSSSNGDGYNNSITTTNGRHHHHHRVAHSSVRVCSDCNTTKTPLLRSGPRGPKPLCNACGIRRIRKARRAMAAEALPDSVIPAIAVPAIAGKISDGEPCSYSFKKSCKLDSTQQKLQLDEFTLSLRKNEAFHRDFHQEEKEAAVLLMALSWGLIRG